MIKPNHFEGVNLAMSHEIWVVSLIHLNASKLILDICKYLNVYK